MVHSYTMTRAVPAAALAIRRTPHIVRAVVMVAAREGGARDRSRMRECRSVHLEEESQESGLGRDQPLAQWIKCLSAKSHRMAPTILWARGSQENTLNRVAYRLTKNLPCWFCADSESTRPTAFTTPRLPQGALICAVRPFLQGSRGWTVPVGLRLARGSGRGSYQSPRLHCWFIFDLPGRLGSSL